MGLVFLQVSLEYLALCETLVSQGLGYAVFMENVGKHLGHFVSSGVLILPEEDQHEKEKEKEKEEEERGHEMGRVLRRSVPI